MEENLDMLFRKYSEDSLSSEESDKFDTRLANDSEFKEAFSDYQLGLIAGKRLLYQDLKANVAEVTALEDRRRKKFKIYKLSGIAAAIIFLVPILLWLSRSTEKPEGLYATYYELPDYSVTRGENNIQNDASRSFVARDYNSAIGILTASDSILNSSPKLQRILAHSYLNADLEGLAIQLFKETSTLGSTAERSEDTWYLGLAFLKNEQVDSASFYLDVVSKDDRFNKPQNVRSLLKKLQRIKE